MWSGLPGVCTETTAADMTVLYSTCGWESKCNQGTASDCMRLPVAHEGLSLASVIAAPAAMLKAVGSS